MIVQAESLQPGGKIEHAGELGDPGPFTHIAVGVVGESPHVFRNGVDRLDGGGGEAETQRILDPPSGAVADEVVSAATGIGAHQNLLPDPVARLDGNCAIAVVKTCLWSHSRRRHVMPDPNPNYRRRSR
ncbi:hypothetical protein [Nocardia arizonensis]|uniref:hypothetical protein n=1 Tax=Nocardia arizonensis TaxID=1141647 RepID=UPI001FD35887|nr:hypothetical protein [Nocardia arizonensis]